LAERHTEEIYGIEGELPTNTKRRISRSDQ
jgi:hypothetical protein